MTSTQIAIVGGGVAGAASACAFVSLGLDVLVLERRDMARDPNRGDVLDGVSVSHLERWGAMEEIRGRGPVELRDLIFSGRRRTLGRVRLPEPWTMLNHADIEAALLTTAVSRGAAVQRRTVKVLRLANGKATLDTDEGEVQAEFVVGADGGSSLIRRALKIEVDRHEYAESLVIVHAPRPSWLAQGSGWVMFHPRGGVLIVPTSPLGRCRIAIFTRPAETRDWLVADAAEIQSRLSERHPALSELEIERGHGSHLYRLARQHARCYHAGPVALVGDAAHVLPPSGGPGMNLAVRDADALVDLTGPVLRTGSRRNGYLNNALDAYERRRRPVNASALDRGHRLIRLRAKRSAYPAAVLATAAVTRVPGLSSLVLRRPR
ncbi:MAG: FAD-dependent oxidoreductase [Solirubrobacterales bacterium]